MLAQTIQGSKDIKMLAQTIQRQVPIGENVKFLLTDGRDVSGRLVELSQDHVTLDSSGKRPSDCRRILQGNSCCPEWLVAVQSGGTLS